MKTIELTQGKVALVDDDDYTWLNQWKWCAARQKNRRTPDSWHAVRAVYLGQGSYLTVSMHRLIMLLPPKPFEVDHEDRDGLNNQRYNIRIATRQQNMANRPTVDRDLPRGVYLNGNGPHRFSAQIIVNYEKIYLGSFATAAEAGEAYRRAHIQYFGEFSLYALAR